MKPAPTETAELLHRVRQQLILSQVRIMELEDEHDELAPRLAAVEKLLAAAQTLADQKTDEAGHLENVRADLQAQYEHLRHMQHVTNEALTATRQQLAIAEQAVAAGRLVHDGLLIQIGHANQQLVAGQIKCDGLRLQLSTTNDQLTALDQQLRTNWTEAAAKQQRLEQLDSEQRAMNSSRSWRWTAWLRALERQFRGR